MIRHTAVALLAAGLTAGAAHSQNAPWTLDVGADIMAGRYAQGGGKSFTFRRAIGTLPEISRVELSIGWVSGSGDYSMFRCHLARQQYCFGGSELVSAFEVAFQLEGRSLGKHWGIEASPVASLGVTRSRSEVSELEGPTTLCFVNGQITSCADNPPFQRFTDIERQTLPSIGYGIILTRATGPIDLRVGLTSHHAGLPGEGFGRGRVSFGVGF